MVALLVGVHQPLECLDGINFRFGGPAKEVLKTMKMIFFRCPACRVAFGLDEDAVGEDDLLDCPSCGATVDPDQDEAQ